MVCKQRRVQDYSFLRMTPVKWQKFIDVSEVHIASMFRVERCTLMWHWLIWYYMTSEGGNLYNCMREKLQSRIWKFCIAVPLLGWQLQQKVEKALIDLQIGVPTPRMGTEGMTADESNGPTAGMPRDRNVLNRYRNYLRQWVRRWRAGVTRCRRMRRKCGVWVRGERRFFEVGTGEINWY